MRYFVTDQFQKINETSGTIQNNSRIFDIEISDKPQAGSGILLYPLNKFTFSEQTLYVRRAEGGGAAIFVVPFIVDSGGHIGFASSVDNLEHFNQDDIYDIFH